MMTMITEVRVGGGGWYFWCEVSTQEWAKQIANGITIPRAVKHITTDLSLRYIFPSSIPPTPTFVLHPLCTLILLLNKTQTNYPTPAI